MRYNLYVLIILTCTLLACKKEAPSPIPAIKAGSITNTPFISSFSGGKGDSIAFTISYQDGDSDLGLRQSEIGYSPYQPTNPDGTPNQFRYNYIVEIYSRHNGIFELVPMDYSATFFYIGNQSSGTIATQHGPFKVVIHNKYEGEITYSLQLFPAPPSQTGFSPGDVLKLRVHIADRALHLSNTVDSPEFVLFQ